MNPEESFSHRETTIAACAEKPCPNPKSTTNARSTTAKNTRIVLFTKIDKDETTGYLEFEILLGTWWDGLLRGYPDIDDYMRTIFIFDSHDTKFTCTDIITGRSIKGRFPRDRVNALLQKYLDNYEAKHPSVKFERESWGAKISNI